MTKATEIALPTTFNPSEVEPALYKEWLDAGLFTANPERSKRNGGDKEPFVIVMPPPNVTAVLHMGHGLNNTVQDVITRWRRASGSSTIDARIASTRARASCTGGRSGSGKYR